MNKRSILCVIALVLFAVFIMPNIFARIGYETDARVYTAALNLTRTAEFLDGEQLAAALEDYKSAGITTAVILESGGKYDEAHLKLAHDKGLNIALVPDTSAYCDADIEQIICKYGVKYIKLTGQGTYDKCEPLCSLIEKYRLTLVLTETKAQLGNESPIGFERYIDAANGRILRSFDSYDRTTVGAPDYPAPYYQMFNSAVERNTRFITVNQLEDDGFSAEENAERTARSVSLFCQRMERLGYIPEGAIDHTDYSAHTIAWRRCVFAASAAISMLMLALMIDLIFEISFVFLGVLSAFCAFGVTFVIPESLVFLYPTLFAAFAPCFCIAAVVTFIAKFRERCPFVRLMLFTVGLSLALILLCGGVLTALLSGADYFLNLKLFRGVKLSLILPVIFTCFLILKNSGAEWLSANPMCLMGKVIRKVKWYHLLLAAAMIAVLGIYILRSGMSEISFAQTYLRNLLGEILTARPRTKEILIGWPCFAAYVYFASNDCGILPKSVSLLGMSILFSSAANTFCHVFTETGTMYLRVFTGVLVGALVSAALLALIYVAECILKKSK